MSRFLAGGIAAMLLLAGGLFWWQSRASNEEQPRPPLAAAPAPDLSLPEGADNVFGAAPPELASATPQMREQKRFQRFDRNRDGIITRIEMMSTRTAAFKKLDTDGNNLLSFEEWAVATGDRFAGADANKDARLNAAEFATTAPKPAATPRCNCD